MQRTARFSGEPHGVASGSTSALPFLELLGVGTSLRVADMSYVTSPCLMRLAECGALRHVSSATADYEPSGAWLAATSDVALVMTDSFGTGSTGTAADVDVDASFDPGILNRGEWIKFVSLFFNAEAAANAFFADLSDSIAAQANAALADAAALGAGRAPVLAFASYSQWDGTFLVSNATYKQQYARDAGATLAAMPVPGASVTYNNWTSPATTAVLADAAAAREALRGVTHLVEETVVFPQSPETYTYAAFLARFGFTAADVASGAWPFLTNGSVYRTDKTINDGEWGSFGTDWFANSVAQPQAVLSDFLTVLYPRAAAAAGRGPTTWLRNLASNEAFNVRESSQCPDLDDAVRAACGGPSASCTRPNLVVDSFTAAGLQAAILAALPAGTGAAVSVTDFQISTQIRVAGAASSAVALLEPAGGVPGFLGALGVVIGHPVSAAAAPVSTSGRRLHATSSSVALAVGIDSFGAAGATDAAATLALLSNGTALLAAVRSAGVATATGASAAGTAVAATVTVTVQGAGADAAMAKLQAAVADGSIGAALVAVGMATPAPATSAAMDSPVGVVAAAVMALAVAALA